MSEELKSTQICYGEEVLMMRVDDCIIFGNKDSLRRIVEKMPKRKAKVIPDDVIITVNGYKYHYEEYFCNTCKKKVLGGDEYCSHCGAKLDWSWNE